MLILPTHVDNSQTSPNHPPDMEERDLTFSFITVLIIIIGISDNYAR
jgi:hypothetical protein